MLLTEKNNSIKDYYYAVIKGARTKIIILL